MGMQPLVYGLNVYAVLFWIVYIVWFVLEIIGAFAQRVKAGATQVSWSALCGIYEAYEEVCAVCVLEGLGYSLV